MSRLLPAIFAALVLLGCSSEEPKSDSAFVSDLKWALTGSPPPTCPQITDALWLPSGEYPPNYSPFGEWQVAEWRRGEPICKAWVKR
jgi:hypothetical protein